MRCYLYGEIGLVSAGKHYVGHLVQYLRDLGGVMLAHREDDRLAYFTADRVAQRILQKGLAEHLIGRFGKEAFFELTLFVNFLLVVAFVILEINNKAVLGEELRRDVAASIDHNRVDQGSVFYSLEQGIAKARLTVFAPEGPISIKQQPSLVFTRISRSCLLEFLQIIVRRCGKPRFIANKVV